MEDVDKDLTILIISQDNRLQVSSSSRKMDDFNNDSSYIKSNDSSYDCGAKQN
jgi:hypothetical protein